MNLSKAEVASGNAVAQVMHDLKTSGAEDGNGFDAPSPPRGQELRLTVATASGRSGVRFAHMEPCGKHSFFITDPSRKFNADAYLNNLAAHFFATKFAERMFFENMFFRRIVENIRYKRMLKTNEYMKTVG